MDDPGIITVIRITIFFLKAIRFLFFSPWSDEIPSSKYKRTSNGSYSGSLGYGSSYKQFAYAYFEKNGPYNSLSSAARSICEYDAAANGNSSHRHKVGRSYGSTASNTR